MNINYLKGKRCMVWSFMGNARMYQALRDYGDRIDTVGIFTFEIDSTGTICETGTDVDSLAPYRTRWPHIKWLLTVMNHGTATIFTALRNNTNGAKDKFLSELVRIMQKYPWCAGVDIDLERGGGYENRDMANALFRDIYNMVKNYNSAKKVNICLPGMTGVQGSVGGENWCVYADLAPYCDTASIMTYGMAWAGSAPGPVSPRSWLEGVYDYAVKVIPPDKIFMGFPTYGWEWQIYDTPQNLGKTYRGISITYYAALYWMQGVYNYTDDEPPQPLIPWISYWDDHDKVPWSLMHVYDFMEGQDADDYNNPLTPESYNRHNYLTSYSKTQFTEFDGVIIDRSGTPDSYTGNITTGEVTTIVDATGEATYIFNLPQAGVYDIAVKLCYPFWDKNTITIELDGEATSLIEKRLWWPYWRTTHWHKLHSQIALSAGVHTIKVRGGIAGVQFHGFRVCKSFTEYPTAGDASFTVRPRHFKDVNGKMAGPDRGFKMTFEVLRRIPDSALIWYEDFRDPNPLNTAYWQTGNGEWTVWHSVNVLVKRPYSQLEGNGRLEWKYSAFQDVHLRTRIAFPQNGAGRAGVFCGNVFCCINIDTSRVELYQGSTLLGSYAADYQRTSDADIRQSPLMYAIEMRIRGNKVRVYSGASSVLRFTANITPPTGYAGVQSDNHIKCELLRLGDAWTYEPYEAFDVQMPDGSVQSFGRIERAGVTWNDKYQVFTLNSDTEESATRSEDITMDYDFQHSRFLPIACGNDYAVQYIPRDINIWLSRLFLGDADGFGMMYYQDVDSIVYWSNEAAYKWGLRGIALWSLGQEDLRLWKLLPKQI